MKFLLFQTLLFFYFCSIVSCYQTISTETKYYQELTTIADYLTGLFSENTENIQVLKEYLENTKTDVSFLDTLNIDDKIMDLNKAQSTYSVVADGNLIEYPNFLLNERQLTAVSIPCKLDNGII